MVAAGIEFVGEPQRAGSSVWNHYRGARRQRLRDHGPGRRRWLTRPRSPPRCLLRSVGLLADGPAVWGRPFSAGGPGVFVIELPSPPATAPHRADPHRQVDRAGADASARRRGHHVAGAGRPDRRVLDPVDDDPVHRQQHHEHRRSRRRDRRHGARRAAALCRRALAEARSPAWTRPGSGGRGPMRSRSTRTPCSVRSATRCRPRTGSGSTTGTSSCRSPTSARRAASARRTACPATSSPRQIGRAAGHAAGHGAAARRRRRGVRAAADPGGRRDDAPCAASEGAASAPRRAAASRSRAPPAGPRAAGDPTYLSTEGIARLRDELAELTTVRRPEVIAPDQVREGARRPQGERRLHRGPRGAVLPGGPDRPDRGSAALGDGRSRRPGADGRVHLGSIGLGRGGRGEAARSTSTGSSARRRPIRPPAGSRTCRRSGGRSSGGASGRPSASRRRAAATAYRIVAIE